MDLIVLLEDIIVKFNDSDSISKLYISCDHLL